MTNLIWLKRLKSILPYFLFLDSVSYHEIVVFKLFFFPEIKRKIKGSERVKGSEEIMIALDLSGKQRNTE